MTGGRNTRLAWVFRLVSYGAEESVLRARWVWWECCVSYNPGLIYLLPAWLRLLDRCSKGGRAEPRRVVRMSYRVQLAGL